MLHNGRLTDALFWLEVLIFFFSFQFKYVLFFILGNMSIFLDEYKRS